MNLHTCCKRNFANIGVLALCVLLVCCAGCGARRSQQYTEQGETYLLVGNVDAAETSFAKAVDLDPKNAAAKMGLARCFWLRKQSDQAIAAYQEAISIDPHLDKAYLEAVRVYLAVGDTAGAEAMAQAYTEVDPVAGGILHSYVLRETGRVQDAVAMLIDLGNQHPDSANVHIGLASCYLSMDQLDKAEAELNAVLTELDKSSLPARMLLVEVYQRGGKLDELVEQLRELVAQSPNNDNLQLALARGLLANQDYAEAEQIARPILEKTPESPWANFVVGACLLQQEKYAEAVDCLSAAFGGLPDEPAVAEMLAKARRGGKAQPAQPVPSPTQTQVVTAPEESWRGLWAQARLSELLVKRQTFLAQEDQEDQEDLAETLVLAAIFSQNAQLARELGENLGAESPVKTYLEALLARQAETAITALDDWSESTPDRQIMHANARGFAYAMAGVRAQALAAFLSCTQNHPEHGVAFFNIANMYRNAGMPKFAIGALRKLIDSQGQNRQAAQMLFDVMTQADMAADARQLAESTYAAFPNDTFATLMLARAYRDTGDTDLAVEVLETAIERSGDGQGMLALAKADILLYMNRVDEAKAVIDGVADSPEIAIQKNMLSAFYAAAKDDWQEAERICQSQAGGTYPLSLRLLHVASLVRGGKTADAAEPLLNPDGTPISAPITNVVLLALKKLNTEASPEDAALADALAERDNDLAQYAYAMACLDARFTPTAVQLLADLDSRLRGKPRLVAFLLSSMARAAGMEDRMAKARSYTEAYPALAAVWLGLAEVARALHDDGEERAALEKAVEVDPGNMSAWLRYAQYLDARSEFDALLNAYRRLAELLPDDPYVKNNLAYCILQTNGDTAEALSLAEAAFEKTGRHPQILHTLGLAQFRSGMLEESWKNLSTALEGRPGDPTLLLDVGQLLLAQGRKEDAQTYLQLALLYASQLGLEFPRRAEAERALAEG